MFYPNLHDLDDLIHGVRDSNSKVYISEAIYAYRAGAYRSSIVSIWISVVYDIIAKIRELYENQNTQAIDFVSRMNKGMESIPEMLRIESNIIETAIQFQLISENDKEFLLRIQKDRHKCAHPAFLGDNELFQPVPELVRSHIVHAINILLKQQPIQGREIINRFLQDIKSDTFPPDKNTAIKYVHDRYLSKSRESVVKNILYLVTKILINNLLEDFKDVKLNNTIKAFIAIKQYYYAFYRDNVSIIIIKIIDIDDNNQMINLLNLINIDNLLWDSLPEHIKVKLKILLDIFNFNLLHLYGFLAGYNIYRLLSIKDLSESLMNKFNSLENRDKIFIISNIPKREFIKTSIEIIKSSSDFRSAESNFKSVILPLVKILYPEDIIEIIDCVKNNSQLHYASNIKPMLLDFYNETEIHIQSTKNKWYEFIQYMLNESYHDYYKYIEIKEKLILQGFIFTETDEGED